MRCVSCGDLVEVAVVDITGTPVGGCGWEGVLSRNGEQVASVPYKAQGQRSVEIRTLTGANVKLGYSAAATMRDAGPVMRRVVAQEATVDHLPHLDAVRDDGVGFD